MSDYDAVIIGAGHNGLICAAYLAQAGLKTLVLEKTPFVGGHAATVELIPGYHFNLGAHLSVFFQEQVVQNLELERHGLERILLSPQIFAPYPDGRYLVWYADLERTCQQVEKQFSPEDAAGFRQIVQFWRQLGTALEPVFLSPPPDLDQLLGSLPGAEAADALRGESAGRGG